MDDGLKFSIVLFQSVNHAMWADSILKRSNIPHKMIPVPKHISMDCGICIRIDSGHTEEAERALGEMTVEWTIMPQ